MFASSRAPKAFRQTGQATAFEADVEGDLHPHRVQVVARRLEVEEGVGRRPGLSACGQSPCPAAQATQVPIAIDERVYGMGLVGPRLELGEVIPGGPAEESLRGPRSDGRRPSRFHGDHPTLLSVNSTWRISAHLAA